MDAPSLQRNSSKENRSPREKAAERFGLDDFVHRVGERAGVDGALAREGTRAVLTTIRQSMPGAEFGDLMAQLPNEFGQVVAPLHWRGARSPAPR